MKSAAPLPRLPYVLLILMSLVSFGGPFAILAAVLGGNDAGWPPDRPIEWVVIAVVIALFSVFFLACVTIRFWFHPNAEVALTRESPANVENSNSVTGDLTDQEAHS